MKLPIGTVIDLLEAEMTEEKCDQLCHEVADQVTHRVPFAGKMLGGLVYGVLDEATPEKLFTALRKLFHEDHTVDVPQSSIVEG